MTAGGGIEGSGFLSTFENIRHLADLCERGAVGPGVNHVHQVRLELVQIRLLVHVQLGVCRDFSDALGTLLNRTEEDGSGGSEDHHSALVKPSHLHLPQRCSQLFRQFRHLAGLGGGGKSIKMTCARSS